MHPLPYVWMNQYQMHQAVFHYVGFDNVAVDGNFYPRAPHYFYVDPSDLHGCHLYYPSAPYVREGDCPIYVVWAVDFVLLA